MRGSQEAALGSLQNRDECLLSPILVLASISLPQLPNSLLREDVDPSTSVFATPSHHNSTHLVLQLGDHVIL